MLPLVEEVPVVSGRVSFIPPLVVAKDPGSSALLEVVATTGAVSEKLSLNPDSPSVLTPVEDGFGFSGFGLDWI